MTINNNASHILIVDDDVRIRALLKKYLVENGYFASEAKDSISAREVLDLFCFDLIILDIMMPGETGINFLKKLRASKIMVPVIMLTAMGEIENKLVGLETGADDYLVKPFEPKELLLRIHNILKRTILRSQVYNFGSFSYDYNSKLLLRDGQAIFLTNSETSLLNLLITHPNTLINRESIARDLNINERSVDVQIVRLRNKIERNPSRPIFLQTIRSKGYMFKIL